MTPWTAARQASLSITNSRSLLKPMSIELVMPSNHLILCHPLLLPPSIFPSLFTQFYTHLVIDVTISSWKQLHPPSSAHLYLLNMLSCSVVSNSATPWIIAHQAPLSRGFPRQGYWRGLPFPPPGDLPDPGIEPCASCLNSLTPSHLESPKRHYNLAPNHHRRRHREKHANVCLVIQVQS